ncbi:toll/interleukin-1 receptor domain-containing protein [Chryseobacterium gleum]|uniref:toll/interleukin-1 receptor domain-containing protein n=1 Tax=Chryseobacterium gleum TaxID=250 RepID=UPI00241C5550|nr:toll/interleukin-1 receptor domain-containing protein [Chryseobacterium gleum]
MVQKGFNKADTTGKQQWLVESSKNWFTTRPCVFLSHKKEDKDACIEIAKYLREAGIDYYLDIEDHGLQYASSVNDPIKITESIKKGIRESTHMMVIVSEKTAKSQWVPFEIGYGHASILDQDRLTVESNKIKLSVLTLKDIAEKTLPDYLRVGYVIKGTKSLNDFISKISDRLEKAMISESRIFSHSKSVHPLDNILNWQL